MLHKFLEHFKVIAETGSIHKASEQLNISQPALSRNLKMLEESMQTTLFIRKNKGVEINKFGEILYQQVCAMGNDYDFAVKEISYQKNAISHHLRLGLGLIWQYSLFTTVFERYYKMYDDVRLSVISGYSELLYKNFLEGHYDIIFGDLEPLSHIEGIVYEPLVTVEFSYYAKKSHPVFNQHPTTEKDLSLYDFAIYTHKSFSEIEKTGLKQISSLLLRRLKFTCLSMISLLTVVNKTDYITSLPVSMSQFASEFGLYEINPLFRKVGFSSGMVYRKAYTKQNYIQKFLEIIRNVVCDGV